MIFIRWNYPGLSDSYLLLDIVKTAVKSQGHFLHYKSKFMLRKGVGYTKHLSIDEEIICQIQAENAELVH